MTNIRYAHVLFKECFQNAQNGKYFETASSWPLFFTTPVSYVHTWYLSFFLHEQNFWRIKFTPKKRVNYDKIHRKLPILCVIGRERQGGTSTTFLNITVEIQEFCKLGPHFSSRNLKKWTWAEAPAITSFTNFNHDSIQNSIWNKIWNTHSKKYSFNRVHNIQ